jgi:hypothetical protein
MYLFFFPEDGSGTVPWQVSGQTDRVRNELPPGEPMFQPRLEPSTSRMKIYRITADATCSKTALYDLVQGARGDHVECSAFKEVRSSETS